MYNIERKLFMRVLFCVNREKDNDFIISSSIIKFLKSKKVLVYIEDEFKDVLDYDYIYTLDSLEKLDNYIDLIILLGGDGTTLYYAHKYIDINCPILTINTGRVGALAGASLDDYQEKIMLIINGNYIIEEKDLIECSFSVNDKIFKEVSLNDVVLHRASYNKLLNITLSISDIMNRLSFYADGIIIATSTGSSAYNLSCGGPLLLKGTNCFVLTPISPQNKVMSPFVFNSNEKLSINLNYTDNSFKNSINKPMLTIDGNRNFELSNYNITIVKSAKKIKFINFDNESSIFKPYIRVLSSNKILT